MGLIEWIGLIVLLVIIGAISVVVWIFRKGKKGVGKIRDRRQERKDDKKPQP